jgi:hypothetical protein
VKKKKKIILIISTQVMVGLSHLIASSSPMVLQRRMERYEKTGESAKSVTDAVSKEQGRSGQAEKSKQVRDYEAGIQNAARSDREEEDFKSNWSFIQARGYS